MKNYFEIGLDILLILIGGGLIVWQSLEIERALASRRWPRVAGKMRQFRREERDLYGDGLLYQPQVLCRYQVGGTEFLCSRLRFGLRGLWWPRLLFVLLRFKRLSQQHRVVESQVPVAYNPEKPEESVLEPGLSAGLLAGLLVGACLFAIGVLELRKGL
jgi:hypothetical protein